MELKCSKCKPVSHEAFLLTHSCDSLAAWKKDYLWDWKCGVYSSCKTHAGSWVAVQSSQGLQAPALQLGTRANYLDVFAQRHSDTSLFCSISKKMEKQYFSNCCSVCNLFNLLSVIVSS